MEKQIYTYKILSNTGKNPLELDKEAKYAISTYINKEKKLSVEIRNIVNKEKNIIYIDNIRSFYICDRMCTIVAKNSTTIFVATGTGSEGIPCFSSMEGFKKDILGNFEKNFVEEERENSLFVIYLVLFALKCNDPELFCQIFPEKDLTDLSTILGVDAVREKYIKELPQRKDAKKE